MIGSGGDEADGRAAAAAAVVAAAGEGAGGVRPIGGGCRGPMTLSVLSGMAWMFILTTVLHFAAVIGSPAYKHNYYM